MSRNDDIWDSRAQRAEDRFTDRPVRTAFGWFVKTCLVLVAIALVGGALFGIGSWISSWGSEAKRITGPENSRQQFTAVIDDYQSLQAAAGNACDAKSGAKSSDDPTLVESPDFAYRAQYRRIAVDYNRRMDNAFEAGVVRRYPGLNKYPRTAPSLREMQDSVC